MVKIHLTNSLSKHKELFIPIDENHITMYACGPTVYDRAHLGNARAAVVYDVLFRLLQACYPKVTYVRNITDIDDKIINTCLAEGVTAAELTNQMVAYYYQDMTALNCLKPTHEPRATQHVTNMINMIEALIAKDYAYTAEGHVLFAVKKFSEYGQLSKRTKEEMIAGSRVEIAPYKRDPADFVLWKPSGTKEEEFGFDSPWGKGRPGWHIECSAMTRAILGEHFDIHGGGADLMFPHHENEIAQSKCSSKHGNFANYWVHNGFLMVDGQKMSKSLGNFRTVSDLLQGGINGSVLRYFYLSTHYRKPLDLTHKALEDAAKSMQKFSQVLMDYVADDDYDVHDEEFLAILADDLNTPFYFARMHFYANAWLKDYSIEFQHKIYSALQLLGLQTLSAEKTENAIEIPGIVMELARLRSEAKNAKDWQQADLLRHQIHEMGFEIVDNAKGFTLQRM
jgi:cysteinyl-tRNA synthetase